jgi:UDP-N-acetylmuramoylalanine-D-glutamate ligase
MLCAAMLARCAVTKNHNASALTEAVYSFKSLAHRME